MRKFYGHRLTSARESRSISQLALSKMVGVTSAAISQYENKDQTPKPQVIESIADKLNFPIPFFFKSFEKQSSERKIYWRSMSAATKAARTSVKHRYDWFREIVHYLSEYF